MGLGGFGLGGWFGGVGVGGMIAAPFSFLE